MPRELEYMDLTDKAVMWEIVASDRESLPIVSGPIELEVRWEEGQVEMVDPKNQIVVVDVTIASTRNIKIGSLIWEGSLADLNGENCDNEPIGTSALPEQDIYQVVARSRGKDLLGRVTRYEFGIKRYQDTFSKQT